MRAPVIFLDMDGVLADLEQGLIDFTGDPTPTVNKGKLFTKYLPAYVAENGFYKQPVLKNAHVLVDGLVRMADNGQLRIGICTSAGAFYTPISTVVDQKKKFIEANFPKLSEVPFVATTSGVDKSLFADKNSMLIDDHGKNITHFINAGGYGIVYHHDEVDTVLAQVQNFCSRRNDL